MTPGDSIRDLSISPRPLKMQVLSSGHVFTHHPKEVTKSLNCQEDVHKFSQVPMRLEAWKNALVAIKTWGCEFCKLEGFYCL